MVKITMVSFGPGSLRPVHRHCVPVVLQLSIVPHRHPNHQRKEPKPDHEQLPRRVERYLRGEDHH